MGWLLWAMVDGGAWVKLPGAPGAVLAVLVRHADRDGRAWPGMRLLRERTGLHPVSIYRATGYLRRLGLIRQVGRRGAATVWQVLAPVQPPGKRRG